MEDPPFRKIRQEKYLSKYFYGCKRPTINTIASNSWTPNHHFRVFCTELYSRPVGDCPMLKSCSCRCYRYNQPGRAQLILEAKDAPNLGAFHIAARQNLQKTVGMTFQRMPGLQFFEACRYPSRDCTRDRGVISRDPIENSYLLTISKVFFHLFVQNKHLKQHKEKHG